MNIWKKLQLEEALSAKIEASQENFGKIEFNSKHIEQNDIFIALSEGKGDGHNYVQDAVVKGAALVIVEKYVNDIDHDKQVLVKNSLDSLYQLALYKRKNTNAKIIAITGSVGKTSFKEILNTILSSNAKVFSSYKNFNNYIGVPLNIASMPDNIDYAIFEVGMSNSNEIHEIVKLLRPNIGVITSIAPVHIENFSSVQEIADAKLEIFDYFDEIGIAVLPKDSEYFLYLENHLRSKNINNIYSFGYVDDAFARYAGYIQTFEKSEFDVTISGNTYHIITSLVGKHHASNISGAIIIASLLNINIAEVAQSVQYISPVEGRGNIINLNFTGKDLIVINDSYNASPDSIKASLMNYRYLDIKNKSLILGDMRELGDKSIEYHENLDKFVLESGSSILITVGPFMKYLHNRLKETGLHCFHFSDVDSCCPQLEELLFKADSVLIKASNGMKLYKIVEYLKKL